ncbi:MAG: exo-beta-N-acetylmuramidase NamZ domain-containing protein [Chitinophagaceae bacterium]
MLRMVTRQQPILASIFLPTGFCRQVPLIMLSLYRILRRGNTQEKPASVAGTFIRGYPIPSKGTNTEVRRQSASNLSYSNILTGAEQTEKYLPFPKTKRVAILANKTTFIGKKYLVDSLVARGITISKIFGPEHGFRGNASNGAEVDDETDPQTGIKIISAPSFHLFI